MRGGKEESEMLGETIKRSREVNLSQRGIILAANSRKVGRKGYRGKEDVLEFLSKGWREREGGKL